MEFRGGIRDFFIDDMQSVPSSQHAFQFALPLHEAVDQRRIVVVDPSESLVSCMDVGRLSLYFDDVHDVLDLSKGPLQFLDVASDMPDVGGLLGVQRLPDDVVVSVAPEQEDEGEGFEHEAELHDVVGMVFR